MSGHWERRVSGDLLAAASPRAGYTSAFAHKAGKAHAPILRRRLLMAAATLLALLVLALLAWGLAGAAPSSRYVLIMDAGSSGTRM
jgi:hypothetical protein